MRINPLPPRRQMFFFVSVGIAVVLAAVCWFFSFKQNWAAVKFSQDSFSQFIELKEEVQEIGADLKTGAQESAAVIAPSAEQAIGDLTEAALQRKEAADLVGGLMKENLETENQYGETQENSQTPTE